MVLICKGHPRVEQPSGRATTESFRCVVCGNELAEIPLARLDRNRVLTERPKNSMSSYPADAPEEPVDGQV